MATALQSFRFAVRSCNCRHVVPRYATKSIGRGRKFSTTPLRWKDSKEEAKVADIEERISNAQGHGFDPFEYKSSLAEIDAAAYYETEEGRQEEMQQMQKDIASGPGMAEWEPPIRRKKLKQTFMNMGEDEPWEEEGMLADDLDDITSLAHGELEQHREMRHYARLAAWDMPLLSKLAKPFEPPTADMPLRFRYTTYMGEQHPAEKKVVLEFSPEDMPDLTELQTEKLRKLAGVRWDPEADTIKMSCEMFETQAQNKRYLGDLVAKLLVEARDPTDTFEDVPFYVKHHRFKPKAEFPEEWKMTSQRRAELEKYRQEQALKDQQRQVAGLLVDGLQQIEEGLAKQVPLRRESLAEMVTASKGGAKKGGKRVSVRR